jgi:hypothetical protein
MPTPAKSFLAVDCESFSNWFCVCAWDGATMRAIDSRSPTWRGEVRELIWNKDVALVGYNNFGYDNLLLKTILANAAVQVFTPAQVNNVSRRIVGSEGRMPDDLFKLQYANEPWAYTVDMYQLLNKKGSLKVWECHEHFPTVAESPVDFTAPLPLERADELIRYCENDVKATWMLFERYRHLHDLRTDIRAHYDVGPRVYALGDAGVTKLVAMADYKRRTGGWSTTARKAAEESPDNRARAWPTTAIVAASVAYRTAEFRDFLGHFRKQTLTGDKPGTNWTYAHDAFAEPVSLGGKEYQIGVGGLHSVDPRGAFRATKDVGIYDVDVASYYPSLILTLGLYPKHIGPADLVSYRQIRDERVAAKRAGDKRKADVYKLVLNSKFGLLNEAHSPIRSIPSALKVTINGQLQLLMLIERFEQIGARILSANTDGVTLMWHRDRLPLLDQQMREWEADTGHELERVEYTTYARRDVNSYVAVTTDGKVKTKGGFEQRPLGGKRDERIVKHAAQEWLLKRTPIRQTIAASTDIRDFIYYQQVKNGGEVYHGTTRLGKIARWYASTDGLEIRRKNPDGTYACLPDGHRATLANELPASWPSNVDISHYMRAAVALCESITKVKP